MDPETLAASPIDHDKPTNLRTIPVYRGILEKNDQQADRNRRTFTSHGVTAVNFLSSPGSGKTSFLCRTLMDLKSTRKIAVIVGDLATDNDARRLGETGVPTVQINTGTVCHLDARMIARAVEELGMEGLNYLMIENVGNLVCPASYDLGESLRVVLLSVTEGEDKPLKYPGIFATAHVVIISKIDLAKAVDFDRKTAIDNIRLAAPQAEILELSARTGDGMEAWYTYLEQAGRDGNLD